MKLPVVKRSFFLFFLCFLPLLSALAAPNQGTMTRKIVEIMRSPIDGDSRTLGKNSESPLKQICPGWHSVGCYSRMTTVGRKWWHPMRPGSRWNRRGERDYAKTACGCSWLTRLKWQIFRTLQTTFNSLKGKKRLLLWWSQNMLFRLKFKNILPSTR